LDTYDYTSVFGPLLKSILNRSYSSVSVPNPVDTDKFTQELRLASTHSEMLEWIIGGFFNHETSDQVQSLLLRDLAGQPAVNDLFTSETPSTYKEYAAFADLTYHFTPALDVSGGVRYAHDKQAFSQNGSGLLVGSAPLRESNENVFTYLANARYHFSPNATGYLRFATGYRPGGPNYVTTNPVTGVSLAPLTFQPDKLKSYEAGIKAETADRRYGVDVDGYYIDWNNIQIATSVDGFSDIANSPGGATVRGAELTLTARPLQSLSMTGGFAYTDAQMSRADPDLGAAKGEQLPNVPKFTGTLNADYQLFQGGWRPSVGATLRYVTHREASFNQSVGFPQYYLPSYTALDLRGGFKYDRADVQLYVRNVFDERGQLSAATNRGPLAQVAILQPLTFGISIATHF
jgi:outer membrane receptor protein involved in Fe transport